MIKVVEVKTVSEWEEIYDIAFSFISGKHGSKECQNIITYDIETSNGWVGSDGNVLGFDHDKYKFDEEYQKFIDTAEAVSCLYIWQYAIEWQEGVKVFVGRTWDEYLDFTDMLLNEIRRQSMYGIKSIDRYLESNRAKRSKHMCKAFCFIHNEGFEFQHLRNVWEEDLKTTDNRKRSVVFARQARKPMKFNITYNRVIFEHRDTVVLTQKTLKAWCKDEKLPVQKLDEPKDYYLKIRTPNTELTEEEMQYSINDVVSMVYGLEKYRIKYNVLSKIPLTQTGAVRIKCRENVSEVNKEWAKHCVDVTKSLTPELFKTLCKLFQGGWTHANKIYVNKVLRNLKCWDFASSYPACLCTRRMPVGKFTQCDISEFNDLSSQDVHTAKYRWFAKVKFTNVRSKLLNSYWSLSKVCLDGNKPLITGQIVDNGRIYRCDEMTILMTDLDYDTFRQCYKYDEDIEVVELYKSEAGYLCKELILTILEYFAYKTSLKGDTDNESLYCESKEFINAIYGVMVYKFVSDMIDFDVDGWTKNKGLSGEEKDRLFEEMFYDTINETSEKKTFSAYQFGVWVTAWARHNLFDFIIPLDERIAYCDTDSIKGLFTEEDMKFIENYNLNIEKLEDKVASELGFDKSLFTATTKKGKIKRLGIMEREEDYIEFKTLGAKRYVALVHNDEKGIDEIHCTIAGLPKSAGENKLKSVSEFSNHTFWDTKESEKLMAVYNDHQSSCTWTDYQGHKYYSEARFGLCLQPTTFDLSMAPKFELFLKTLANQEISDDEYFNHNPSWIYN